TAYSSDHISTSLSLLTSTQPPTALSHPYTTLFRSLMLDWLLAIFLVGGFRFAIRITREARGFMKGRAPQGKRAFIIGAGEAGEQLLRQLSHDQRRQLRIVGLIDDDPNTHGRSLHGVRVLGGVRDLRRLAAHYHVELLIIAIPSADRAQLR